MNRWRQASFIEPAAKNSAVRMPGRKRTAKMQAGPQRRTASCMASSRASGSIRAASRWRNSGAPKRRPQWNTSASAHSNPNQATTIRGSGCITPLSVSAAAASSRMSSLIGRPKPLAASTANTSA